MADRFPPKVRSRIMASIRGKDTGPEIAVRRILWRHGLRYRTHDKTVLGRPDISNKRKRLAVFVDGPQPVLLLARVPEVLPGAGDQQGLLAQQGRGEQEAKRDCEGRPEKAGLSSNRDLGTRAVGRPDVVMKKVNAGIVE